MIKKNDRFFRTLFMLTLSSLLCACSNTIDSMIEDYNGHFVVQVDLTDGSYPGDEDFDETLMLDEIYYAYTDGSFILAAPMGCNGYQWTIYNALDKDRTELAVKASIGSSLTSRVLNVYVPDSGLEAGTYKVCLTIDVGGVKYRDNCALVIHINPKNF